MQTALFLGPVPVFMRGVWELHLRQFGCGPVKSGDAARVCSFVTAAESRDGASVRCVGESENAQVSDVALAVLHGVVRNSRRQGDFVGCGRAAIAEVHLVETLGRNGHDVFGKHLREVVGRQTGDINCALKVAVI